MVTHALIALNLGVFLFMAIMQSQNPEAADKILQWGQVGRHGFTAHGLVTSAFFHAGFLHIFGNMIFLLVFGVPVEDRFGHWWYLLFYLAGACVSGLAHIAVDPHPAIGASGAVAAVAGAFLVLFPRTRIRCFVFFIFIGVFMIPAWWLIGLYFVFDIIEQTTGANNGVANMAHLGGYAFGFSVAFVLLTVGLLAREPYDLFSILKHKQRKRAFANASKIHEQSMEKVMRTARQAAPDPKAQHIAHARSAIGALLSEGQNDEAADAYLRLIDEFGHDESAPLTLHRDAQYQIANTLYQRGDRVRASDAFVRLLSSYPADPERHIIGVLIARTRADEQGDVPGAITMLEEIRAQTMNNETQAIVDQELDRIRGNTDHTGQDTAP